MVEQANTYLIAIKLYLIGYKKLTLLKNYTRKGVVLIVVTSRFNKKSSRFWKPG